MAVKTSEQLSASRRDGKAKKTGKKTKLKTSVLLPKNAITYVFPSYYEIDPLVVHDCFHIPTEGNYVELMTPLPTGKDDEEKTSWWRVKFVKFELDRLGKNGEQKVLVYLDKSPRHYQFGQY